MIEVVPDKDGFLRAPVITELGDGYMIAHQTTKREQQWFEGRSLCGTVTFRLAHINGDWTVVGLLTHCCEDEDDCTVWDFLTELGLEQGPSLQ